MDLQGVSLVKIIVDIVISVAVALMTAAGVYWRIHYKMRDHDRQIGENTRDICDMKRSQEKANAKVDRKLNVIGKNIERILEKLNMAPSKDIFDED